MVAAAGCTSGPDYHVPEHAAALTPSANHAFLGADQTGISQAPLPDRWWTLYNDPRLDGYVAEALRANADLRAADANLRRAAALVREAEDSRSVHTDIEAEALESRVGGYTLPLPGTPFSYVLGVTATLPLDLAGGLRRGIEEAGAVSEATQATRDQVRVVVAAAVARSYAGVCSANWSLAAAQHVVDVQTETLSAINRNVRGGRGTSFDATRARAAVDLSAAALPPLLADRQRALFELAELMGRPAAANPIEAESCATPPSLKQPIPIGDGARLIQRRPDIRAAERQLAASTAGIGVATA
ncbi:MAG: TolC family protein, partial [Nevskia sp.]|nr:TolC family protein [Nevskia sp.]